MNNAALLVSQRNEVFNTLRTTAVAPFLSDLKWKFDSSSTLSCTHGLHEYSFSFYREADRCHVVYFPDHAFNQARPSSGFFGDRLLQWSVVLKHVAVWGECVGRQLREVDQWTTPQSLADAVLGAHAIGTEPHTHFTPSELQRLQDNVSKYRDRLHSLYVLSPQQSAEIDEKLTYLVEQAKSQTRQGWINTAIGVVVSIAAIIKPEAGVVAGLLALFASLMTAQRHERLPADK